MATLLFRLNNVLDDEAMEIRELLSAADIPFYETNAGFWRIGVDAIWLSDNTNAERARELIRSYQLERSQRQRQSYVELLEQGRAPTLWQNFCAAPFRFAGLMLAALFVLLLTLLPFVMLLKR